MQILLSSLIYTWNIKRFVVDNITWPMQGCCVCTVVGKVFDTLKIYSILIIVIKYFIFYVFLRNT